MMVAFVDVDHFKVINDSMGHEWGDRVLCLVAERIKEAVRPGDTVARLGGDEFVVLCDVSARRVQGVRACRPDRHQSAGPSSGRGSRRPSSRPASGWPWPIIASTSPERLLGDADSAMYRAKECGRASIELYDEQKDIWSIGRLRVGNDLHRAIARNEFELHYQPFVDLQSGRRWWPSRPWSVGVTRPGACSRPASSSRLAEDTGLIVPIGSWVLREACAQSARWRRARAPCRLGAWRSSVSINVSPRQLAEKQFPQQLEDIVRESGVDPDFVWLEITEGTLLRDPDRTIQTLVRSATMGCTSPSMISAPGTRPSATSSSFPSSASRSTVPSSTAWTRAPKAPPSSRRSSPWPTPWGWPVSPKASRHRGAAPDPG